jgi:DNA ligase-1
LVGMAGTGTQEGKRQALLGLLRRAGNREAVYLLKIILGDMRTGVSEGIVEAGIAEAFGVKVGEVRGARLLVGDLDVVAELAMEGRLGEAAFRPFVPLGYMLAQPVMTTGEIVEALAGRGAVAEDKYDGIRAQLHVAAEGAGVRVELFSRGSGAVTQSFPDIANAVAGFAKRTGRAFVLDGEIVPMRLGRNGDRVMLPFSMLQKRLGRKVLTAKQMVQNPVAFVAFDCLYAEGELLLERPLAERREKLRGVLEGMEAGVPVVVSGGVEVTTAEGLEGVFAAARVRRNEGLVIKRLDSLYTPGRRGDAWMKLKSHLPTLDVVVVGAELGHGKRRGVLSDVTFAVRAAEGSGELLTVGKAYTGLTDVEIAGLTERFMGETVEVRGRFRVVRPTVVLEIAFDQLTKSERHTSGYAMRFPRIVRIREDKTVEGIDTLERVRQIYVSPDNLALGHEGEKVAESLAAPDQLTLF